MQGLIVQKIKMSQMIGQDGEVTAITVMKAKPNVIAQIKKPDKDGYFALQLGLTKPAKGKSQATVIFEKREFRFPEGDYKVGDTIGADIFAVDDTVSVTGITIGKGFAGTVKRHHFSRGPETHGHDHHRQPGSIGAMGMPRVHKGKHMAGRMGGTQVTTKNLKIAAVDSKNHLIAITGSVPGANKQFVIIKKQAND